MKKVTNDNTNDKKKEEMIQQALRTGGFLFPETPDEVVEFEKKFGNTDIILPEDLREAPLSKKNVVKLKQPEKKQNLAMAAREGSQLPDEVLKKMKEDRDKARKGKKK